MLKKRVMIALFILTLHPAPAWCKVIQSHFIEVPGKTFFSGGAFFYNGSTNSPFYLRSDYGLYQYINNTWECILNFNNELGTDKIIGAKIESIPFCSGKFLIIEKPENKRVFLYDIFSFEEKEIINENPFSYQFIYPDIILLNYYNSENKLISELFNCNAENLGRILEIARDDLSAKWGISDELVSIFSIPSFENLLLLTQNKIYTLKLNLNDQQGPELLLENKNKVYKSSNICAVSEENPYFWFSTLFPEKRNHTIVRVDLNNNTYTLIDSFIFESRGFSVFSNPFNSSIIVVVTDYGVFKTDNAGNDFYELDIKIPECNNDRIIRNVLFIEDNIYFCFSYSYHYCLTKNKTNIFKFDSSGLITPLEATKFLRPFRTIPLYFISSDEFYLKSDELDTLISNNYYTTNGGKDFFVFEKINSLPKGLSNDITFGENLREFWYSLKTKEGDNYYNKLFYYKGDSSFDLTPNLPENMKNKESGISVRYLYNAKQPFLLVSYIDYDNKRIYYYRSDDKGFSFYPFIIDLKVTPNLLDPYIIGENGYTFLYRFNVSQKEKLLLYRTYDCGRNWVKVDANIPDELIDYAVKNNQMYSFNIIFSPLNPDSILVYSTSGNIPRFYFSSDGGKNWSKLTDIPKIYARHTINQIITTDKVYLFLINPVYSGGFHAQVNVSSDLGNTWKNYDVFFKHNIKCYNNPTGAPYFIEFCKFGRNDLKRIYFNLSADFSSNSEYLAYISMDEILSSEANARDLIILNISPNPFNKFIKFEPEFDSFYDISIFTIDGRIVFKKNNLSGQYIWDGKNLSGYNVKSGVYLVKIKTSKEVILKKLIKFD